MSIIKRLLAKYGTREKRVKGEDREVLAYLKSLKPKPSKSRKRKPKSK
jgi:hypothetical protein